VRIGLFGAEAAAAIAVHVPATNAIGTPAPGTRLGEATAVDAGGALAGALVAAAPASASCGVAAVQTWNLHLAGGGRTLDVPVYVTGAGTLVLCPATPLRSVSFAASAIAVPPGLHRWSSTWTGGGGETLEAQALDPGPLRLVTSIRRRRVAAKARVATYVRVSSHVASGATAVVTTRANGRRVGGATGSFLLAGIGRATVTVTAVANGGTTRSGLVYRDLGTVACLPAGPPCVGATLGGARLSARTVVKAFGR
jgi:hypothetical protein